MKKLMLGKVFAVAALFLCAVCAHAQGVPTVQVSAVTSAPVGICTQPALQLDLTTGNLWSCSATWRIDPNTGLPLLVSSGLWIQVTGATVNCSNGGSLLYFTLSGIPCDPNIATDGSGHLSVNTVASNSFSLGGSGAFSIVGATGTGLSNPPSGFATWYVDSVSGQFTCLLPSGSCNPVPVSGTVTYTSSHAASSADNGKLVIFNCSSACAFTLPNPQPSTNWAARVMTVGSTTATVALGSTMTYNGGSSVPVLNGFRIMAVYANSATATDYDGEAPLAAGTNITVTPTANGFTIAVPTALANGTLATTQSSNDNSTKLATTAYADRKGFIISGDCDGTVGASSGVAYPTFPFNQSGSNCSTNTVTEAPMPAACTATTIYATAQTAGALTTSGGVGLYKNGSLTALTCNLGTGTACNLTGQSVSFNAGDTYSIRVKTAQASDTTATVRARAICIP